MCPTPLSFQPIFSKFTPNIHWPMILAPVHFCHQLVTFVTTRETTFFFLWALYRAEFSTDLIQIYTTYSLDPDIDSNSFSSLISYICGRNGSNFVFLCTLHRAEFSTDIEINTKCSLDQDLDSNSFLSLISYICYHQRANFVYLVCALHLFVFNGSFSDLHQIFVGPWYWPQYILPPISYICCP